VCLVRLRLSRQEISFGSTYRDDYQRNCPVAVPPHGANESPQSLNRPMAAPGTFRKLVLVTR
jgi:hypothetical protein